MSDTERAIFVYGTLKKGHLRGGLWPRRPESISPAVVQGDLYDLGPYPAATYGTGWILGEVWLFHETDILETCEVLDRIEGYDLRGSDNEYIRVSVETRIYRENRRWLTGSAWMYLIGNPARLHRARKIELQSDYFGLQVAQWPDSRSRVPKSFAEE